MRPAALIGLLAVAASLGALIVGQLVMLPGLGQHQELIDANLAKALAEPMHLRLAELGLAAHLVVAALAHAWLGRRFGTTLGLLLVGASAAQRFFVLPALYAAWSRADLVAGRPVDYILRAERFELADLGLVAGMTLVLLGLLASHVWLRMRATPAANAADRRLDPNLASAAA